MAIQASTGRASQIAESGLLGWQELVRPFHNLFARISNKIYFESLRHTSSSCAVSFAVPFNFNRFLISTLHCVVPDDHASKNNDSKSNDSYAAQYVETARLPQSITILSS